MTEKSVMHKSVWLWGGVFSLVIPALALSASTACAEEIVLPESESNKNILNYLELVDSFVTAERIPSGRWDTPANVYVITAQEIEDNHYRNLTDALNHVPGVYVSYLDECVVINGNSRNLILLDGQRLDNSTGIWGNFSVDTRMIPSMNIIERIEIVKGSGSALYGTDAIGGVVNIITKKINRHETAFNVNYGSWESKKYELYNSGVKGKFSWMVTGSLAKSDDYHNRTETDELKDISDYYNKGLFVKLGDRFSDSNSLDFKYLHLTHKQSEVYRTNGARYDSEGNYYEFSNSDYTVSDIYNDLQLSYNFKETTSTPSFLRYFYNRKTSYRDQYWAVYGNGETKTHGLDYQNGWEIGKHKFIVGAELHRERIKFDQMNYDVTINTQAYYLQDTLKLTDKWTLIPGVRLDHNSDYGSHWSPKTAVNYRADDKTKIYASWGKVYRTPTSYDKYTNGVFYASSTPQYYWGADHSYFQVSLTPETGHNENLGFEHAFNDNTNISVNFFNTRLKNVVYWAAWSTNSFTFTEPNNDGTEKQRGMDLSFHHNINDFLSVDLGYAHIHKDRNYPNAPSSGNDLSLWVTPGNTYHLGLHFAQGRWKANLTGTVGTNLGLGLSNFKYFDFNTSYSFNDNATVYALANNFTNALYSQRYGSNGPGRYFQIGFNYTF